MAIEKNLDFICYMEIDEVLTFKALRKCLGTKIWSAIRKMYLTEWNSNGYVLPYKCKLAN